MNIERMLKFNNNRTYCLDCLAISTIGNQTVQHAAIQLELASATNHANNPKSPSPRGCTHRAVFRGPNRRDRVSRALPIMRSRYLTHVGWYRPFEIDICISFLACLCSAWHPS
jgi:hypothetical protein